MSNMLFCGLASTSPKKTFVLSLTWRRPLVEVVGVVDEGDFDTQLRHRVVQQVVRAAVQRR